MNQERIGKFIRELRKDKGITQQELAKKLGVTDKAISKWENGRCLMDISFLKPLSEILEVSIVELLSGEKIKKEDINKSSINVVEKTLSYADEKIKKNKIRWSIIITLCVIIFILSTIGLYKLVLISIYKVEPPENYEQVIKGLSLDKELKIYKKTIPDTEYLKEKTIKFKNNFSDYKKEIVSTSPRVVTFTKYDSNNKNAVSQFVYSIMPQNIDIFSDEVSMFGSDQNIAKIEKNFNSADRKYFLLRNDINDDLDFLKYIKKNYILKSTIFTSSREIKENYALNTYARIVIPKVNSTTIIKGDYKGYIYTINKYKEVHIIRNNKDYIFSFRGEEFIKEDYIKEFLSTLEIK